jgi:hypothetical protein
LGHLSPHPHPLSVLPHSPRLYLLKHNLLSMDLSHLTWEFFKSVFGIYKNVNMLDSIGSIVALTDLSKEF